MKPYERFPPEVEAAFIVRHLLSHEAFWRERVGDEEFERSVAYWRGVVESGPH